MALRRSRGSQATPEPSVAFQRAITRASKLDQAQLYDWLATTILQLGQTFDDHRYHDGPIEEVGECLSVAGVLCAEIDYRLSSDRRSTS